MPIVEQITYLTYTCPVSRKTYAGHPRNGHLYVHENDVEEAINVIKGIASRHGQPVSWVINDQEYLNVEGLLPYFLKWQEEGDAILVTMELTTSPEGVDKYDTAGVIRWIDARCREAGLRIDGLWSLKFLESDMRALASLSAEEFPWTRNLAGSCWHQYGIDDSTWGGAPFMPYYPSVENVRAAAGPDEPGEFLMLEWLSRDINAILRGGFPAVFALDPADSNRADMGGFDNEPDALWYSQALIAELARQRRLNPTLVIHMNEEARHWQNEGHDKAYMLEGMFACAGYPPIAPVKRASYREIWREFRERHPTTPERIFSCRSVDLRQSQEPAVLFEDEGVQMGFVREKGSLPVELYNYAKDYPGNDGNEGYPKEDISGVRIISQDIRLNEGSADFIVTVSSDAEVPDCGLVLWDAGVPKDARLVEAGDGVKSARGALDGHLFIRVSLNKGDNCLKGSVKW